MNNDIFDIAGQKILLTGASGGIGQAIAKELDSRGARLCISGTRESALHELATSLTNNPVVITCDLSSTQVNTLVTRAQEQLCGLDALICNAGVTMDNLALRMRDTEWQKVIDINLNATFELNQAACKYMLKNSGCIINISSVVAFTGNPGQANYAAAKAGVIAMSKSLAREFAKRKVRINCLAPGFIATPMTDKLTLQQQKNIIQEIPLERIGVPEDIVGSIILLLSKAGKYITGQTIHINGGLFML